MLNMELQKKMARGKVELTKALIEYEVEECDITLEIHLTNTGLLNAMGWHNNNHGLQVKEEACQSDYILFQTKLVKNHIQALYHRGAGKRTPAWIKTFVVNLKKWKKEGWESSFVNISCTTANKATYVALIRNEMIQTKYQVSDDDDSSRSSKEEDSLPRTKGTLIAN